MTKTRTGSRRYDVLAAVRENPRASMRELCEMTGLKSTSVVSYHLDQLEKEGALVREHNTARGIYLGSDQPKRIAKRGPKAQSCPKYSDENYSKKAAAGRKGRGVSAGTAMKRNLDLEARIEAIGRRNDQLVVDHDVINGKQVLRLSDLRACKVG